MPKLLPINAVTYNTDESNDLSSRIAPPYDVLDEGPKQTLLAKDTHNVVAIDLPVTPPKTVGPDEAYQQAGDTFRAWLEQGVLQRADKPGIYAYEQVYEVAGQSLARRGLIAGLGVEPFNRADGGIFRHEMTIAGGINDRYKLMEATKAQLSPIFAIYGDPEGEVAAKLGDYFDNREPDFHGITDSDGVTHRVWRVDDDAIISSLQSFFVMTDVYIADGHHRYTTALKFGEDHGELPGAEGCLFVLVAAEDPGMIVLPTHRVLLGVERVDLEKLQAACDQAGVTLEPTDFTIEQAAELAEDLPNHDHHAMGLYLPGQDKLWRLTCHDSDPLSATQADKPEVWRQLDVAILQHLIVEQILTLNFAPTDVGNENKITYKYTAKLDELISLTDAESNRLGIIMQPTPLQSVMEVSKANEVMPAKSTYFFPKLATGLVINALD